LAWAV